MREMCLLVEDKKLLNYLVMLLLPTNTLGFSGRPRGLCCEHRVAALIPRRRLIDRHAPYAAPRRFRKLAMAGANASSNSSMSASRDAHPRLSRIAPAARSGAIAIAVRTCERAIFPDEQAEPDDAATPARSRRISSVAAAIPGTAKHIVLGRRGAPAPNTTASGAASKIRVSSRSRSAA